jgi:hypothetical protein
MINVIIAAPVGDIPRLNHKDYGGGLIDTGVYGLAFVTMIFKGLRPQKIVATGHLFESGR